MIYIKNPHIFSLASLAFALSSKWARCLHSGFRRAKNGPIRTPTAGYELSRRSGTSSYKNNRPTFLLFHECKSTCETMERRYPTTRRSCQEWMIWTCETPGGLNSSPKLCGSLSCLCRQDRHKVADLLVKNDWLTTARKTLKTIRLD